MDEGGKRPSLADDPDFLVDLDLLDQALGGHPVRKAKVDAPAPPASAAPPPPAAPSPPPAPPASAAPPAATLTSVTPAPPEPAARRPLIELLPAPTVRDGAPPPEPPPPHRYQTFYGLTEPPFALEPDTRFLFHSTAHDHAMRQLFDALDRHEGVLVLTGPAGIGKTIMCRAIVEQLDRRWFASFVTAPTASFDDVVRKMLVDFGVHGQDDIARHPADDRGELVSTLRSFLDSLAAPAANALLVVDDAHKLPPGVLADLRRFASDDSARLQVLLAGEPSINAMLGHAEARASEARVSDPIALAPLAADEVPGYVMHRIQVAGMGPRVEFDDESLAVLHDTSGGVPRLVNLIADRALAIAFGSASGVIDAAIVETAAVDVGAMEPRSRGHEWLQVVALGLLLALLAGLGAGAAAWIFRDRVHQAVIQWQAR